MFNRWGLLVAVIVVGFCVGFRVWQNYVAAPNVGLKVPTRGISIPQKTSGGWRIQAVDLRRNKSIGRPFYVSRCPTAMAIAPSGVITVVFSDGTKESHSFWGDKQPDRPVDNRQSVALAIR